MKIEDYPAGEAVRRIGNPYYDSKNGTWSVRINRRVFTLHHQWEKAKSKWNHFMASIGHPRPKGQGAYHWSVQHQKWYRQVSLTPREWATRHKFKQLAKQSAHQLRRRLYDVVRERVRRFQKMMTFKKLSRHLKKNGLDGVEVPDARRVIMRQKIGKISYHKASDAYFCWIGVTSRKLILLGNDRDTAKRLWLLLKHGLQGGSTLMLTEIQRRRGSSPELSESA